MFFNALLGTGVTPEELDVDVWIVAGQSNTDGRVPISSPPTWLTANNTVLGTLMFNSDTSAFDTWKYGVNAGSDNNQDTRWAYDSTALYQYAALKSKTQCIVKNTRGGTSIGLNPIVGAGSWNVDFNAIPTRKLLQELENKFTLAIADLVADNKTYTIKGMLWHQGESDSTSTANQNDYYDNFTDVINYVRGFTGVAALPVIFGTISHASAQYSSVIESAQLQIASQDANAYVVDMQNGTLLDPYHFGAISSEYLGDQMYTIMTNL